MEAFKLIIDTLLDCMTINFTVFGYKLNLLSVYIGTSLISIVVFGILRVYR